MHYYFIFILFLFFCDLKICVNVPVPSKGSVIQWLPFVAVYHAYFFKSGVKAPKIKPIVNIFNNAPIYIICYNGL